MLLLAVPLSSRAIDVELGADLGVEYDDNVFVSSSDPQGDFFGRFGPRLRIMDDDGRLTWGVNYSPRYRRGNRFKEISGWDQDLSAYLSWRVGKRTTLTLSDRFVDYSNFSTILTDDLLPDGSIDTGIDFQRQALRQNALSLGLEHQLTRRHSLGLSASYVDSRFQTEFRNRTKVSSLGGSYQYVVDETDTVGFSLAWTRQTVGVDVNEKDTNYYGLSFLWIHEFDPTLTLDVSVGPTLIETEPTPFPTSIPDALQFPLVRAPTGGPALTRFSSCPRGSDGIVIFDPATCQALALPPNTTFQPTFTDLPVFGDTSLDNQSLTYFAAISLSKTWHNYNLRLSYSRDAADTTQVSGAVSDVLSLTLSWALSQRWQVNFAAAYQRNERSGSGFRIDQVVESATVEGESNRLKTRVRGLPLANPIVVPITVPISDVAESRGFRVVEVDDDKIRADQYTFGVSVLYALTRNLRLYANAYWTNARSNVGSGFEQEADRLRVGTGVLYTFDRFQLPF
jgi:hypothetical protein